MSSGTRQLPLDLGHRPEHSRDHFVVSPENAAALRLVDSWPQWPAPVALLVGPSGSGKSHLLAIFSEEQGAVNAGENYAAAIEAAEEGHPIILDDADRHLLSQTQLFHLINAVRSGQASLLMTARQFPSGWELTLPDLISRLKAAAIVEIEAPGDMLMSAVITKLFADRQLEVEPHVIDFLTRRIERSLAAAIRVVELIDHEALEQRRTITRALAAEVLGRFSNAEEKFT